MIGLVVAASILLAPPPPGPTIATEAAVIKQLTRAWVAATQEEAPPPEAPSAAPASAPPPPAAASTWLPLVADYFEPADHATALCLIWHESRGDPGAINPASGARGLLQVMPDWADDYGTTPDGLLDPATNLRVAAAIRYAPGWGGWHHWSPWNRGECQ